MGFKAGAALLGTGLCITALMGARAGAQAGAVSIAVDAGADRRAINPYVCGVAWASAAQLADLNVALNRQGGNAAPRCNWQINASNRGADW